ncbi:MAG: metalloregulator ArsR/SmtB family transcription factor [Bdellovibrio bacteriovorus]
MLPDPAALPVPWSRYGHKGAVARTYGIPYIRPMQPSPVALFAALANATHLRCLLLLARRGELCVCELTDALGLSQPHVSRHLAQLREAGWVADRRHGVWVYYRIAPGLPPWARMVLGESARGLSRVARPAHDRPLGHRGPRGGGGRRGHPNDGLPSGLP